MARTTAIFARDLDRLGKGVSQLSLSKLALVSMAISLHNFSGNMSSQHRVPTCCFGIPLELGCLQDMYSYIKVSYLNNPHKNYFISVS